MAVSSAGLCPCSSPSPSPHGHSAYFTAFCLPPFSTPPEPIMMSLRPGSELLDSQPLSPERPVSNSVVQVSPRPLEAMAQPVTEDGQPPCSLLEEKAPKWTTEHRLEEKSWLTNGFDVFECPPPKTENEVGERLQDGSGWWAGRKLRVEGQPAGWLGLDLNSLSKFSHHVGSEEQP